MTVSFIFVTLMGDSEVILCGEMGFSSLLKIKEINGYLFIFGLARFLQLNNCYSPVLHCCLVKVHWRKMTVIKVTGIKVIGLTLVSLKQTK